jgi:Peptidase family M1 domain
MGVGRAFAATAALAVTGFAVNARAQASRAPASSDAGVSARELYRQLNDLRLDPAEVYSAKDLTLRKGDVRVILVEGKLAFFTLARPPQESPGASLPAVRGSITGAVFLGRGHALAMPRDPVEKRQMGRFLGVPLLDQWFTSAYLRFTDGTAEELMEQLRAGGAVAQDDPEFTEKWKDAVAGSNPGHSLRILEDWLSEKPQPYFYARLDGVATGPFDVLLDTSGGQEGVIGQQRTADGATYYDVWASYAQPGAPLAPPAMAATKYEIETTVFPDRALEGTTTIHLRAERGGERVLELELARYLSVQSAELGNGEALDFFQNEDVNRRELASRGNDAVLVVLPRAIPRGEELALRLHYKGSVISDAGNGVFFVGDRGSWYPRAGGIDSFADYEMTLRWPRRLKLAATGTKLEEREDGEFKTGRWRSEQPIPVAGFNLGEYASTAVTDKNLTVEVYANRQLENELAARLAAPEFEYEGDAPLRGGVRLRSRLGAPPVGPGSTGVMKQIGREVVSAIRFYEQLSGPFPYAHLEVSQIPGTFGQGWPGLLYVSTLSFLTDQAQQRAGLTPVAQEQLSELMPFHEVAHQWWGNVVSWSSYRDQWINEAIADYLSLMFADNRRPSEHSLRRWLERYRERLLEHTFRGEGAADDAGPLVLGYRLNSSKSPGSYERVVYGKGAWVIHMLRMMLRQPDGRDPDARFRALLGTLVTKYRLRALTTIDLQREIEAVMTPAMDLEGGRSMEWFFAQWVRGTGIPHYRAEFRTQRTEKGSVVRGTLWQTGVPESFVAPVPVYARTESGKQVYLGTVMASGEKTVFHFTTPIVPQKLVIDPQMTLLCVIE